MLQRAVWSQLARVVRFVDKQTCNRHVNTKKATIMALNYPGPTSDTMTNVVRTLEMLPDDEKHWLSGGVRSCCVAVDALKKNQIIAVPTDTIYGFAARAQNSEAIDNLYSIKGRVKTKPLAITLGGVREIQQWAEIDHIPSRLLADLLPGPVTVVLKRKKKLNKALNPEHESVGIRVPRSKFIRKVCKMIGEPLALTSANISNEPSSLHPEEFKSLWPRLGVIFYGIPNKNMVMESRRVGSTVVDLTEVGKYKILRKGIRYRHDVQILRSCLSPAEEEESKCLQESAS